MTVQRSRQWWQPCRLRHALALAGLIVALDQATKYAVMRYLPAGHEVDVWGQTTSAAGADGPVVVPAFFRLVHLGNTGAAWGILSGRTGWLALLSLVAVAAILVYYRQFSGPWWERHLALGLVLGGVLGNLVDRLGRGQVVDFLSFSLSWASGRAFEWPAFNVADSAIVTGVVILLGSSFWRPEENAGGPPAPAPARP